MAPTPARRFAVTQVRWHLEDYTLLGDDAEGYARRLPRADRVAEFDDYAAAAADAAGREAEARGRPGVNPFRYGGASLFYQSSLPAPQLHDWLLDRGIEAPLGDGGHRDYVRWWERVAPGERAVVWEALDKVRFFEVTEVPAARAFVVVEVNWTWNDNQCLDADPEGGKPLKAFRSRATAEAHCAALNRERRAAGEFEGYATFDRTDRDGGGYTDIADTVFFEVVEVDAGG